MLKRNSFRLLVLAAAGFFIFMTNSHINRSNAAAEPLPDTNATAFELPALKMSTWPVMPVRPTRKILEKLRSSCRTRGRNSVPGATSGTVTDAETRRGAPAGNTAWPAGHGAGHVAG